MSPSRIAAVVVAAGLSRRMGQPKALMPLGGMPLIVRVVEPIFATRCVDPIVVVTGHASDQVCSALQNTRVQIVHNPDYESGGMLSSVKAGIRAIADRCDAFFLVLGDQPMIRSDTYTALLDVAGLGRIIQPTFDAHAGHPILLQVDDIEAICALPDGATLKDHTRAHRRETLCVPVDDPGILADIDTPEDYDRAVEFFAAHRSSPCIKPLVMVQGV